MQRWKLLYMCIYYTDNRVYRCRIMMIRSVAKRLRGVGQVGPSLKGPFSAYCLVAYWHSFIVH